MVDVNAFKKHDMIGVYDFAIRIPITDEEVIQELNERKRVFLAANPSIDAQQEGENVYYITIQLCSVHFNCMLAASKVWGELLKQEPEGLRLRKEQVLLNDQSKALPVALIDTSSIRDMLFAFTEKLRLNRIKYSENFTPYVELCTQPATAQAILPPAQCKEVSIETAQFELACLDNSNQYQEVSIKDALTIADAHGVNQKRGIYEVMLEIERLRNNSKSLFSIGNKTKIKAIEDALEEAMKTRCVGDVRYHGPLQLALQRHRIFGFFGQKEARSWTNIRTQLDGENEAFRRGQGPQLEASNQDCLQSRIGA